MTSRPKLRGPLRIWPTRSGADTTTPSLCSDNENDHSEDKPPDTPSDIGRGIDDNAQSVKPRERQLNQEPEIIDVDALETPPKRQQSRSASPIVEAESRKDAFARRPPANPMPTRSPVKPMPPARVRTKVPAPSKLPLPRRVPIAPQRDPGSDSDDPLLMDRGSRSQSLTEQLRDEMPIAGPSRRSREHSSEFASAPVRSRSQSQSQPAVQAFEEPQQPESRPRSRLSNHARRRLTLDEELRKAGDSLWRESSEEPERPPSPPQADLDSGHLVALGTKSSKRGFLARGGGAGAPVFMGEGYVQGVSAEHELGATEVARSRSASMSTSVGGTSRSSRRR